MPNLGTAALTLVVKGAQYARGLKTAEKQATTTAGKVEKQSGRMGKAFSNFGDKVQSSARKIPILGGACRSSQRRLGCNPWCRPAGGWPNLGR